MKKMTLTVALIGTIALAIAAATQWTAATPRDGRSLAGPVASSLAFSQKSSAAFCRLRIP